MYTDVTSADIGNPVEVSISVLLADWVLNLLTVTNSRKKPMMDKEIEKLIIREENIDEAKGLAYDLGYSENYPYGVTNPTYYEEMAACITALVGLDENGHWPDAVEEAYKQGSRDGWWDS